MKCQSLLKELDVKITKEKVGLLKPENCSMFFLDSIRFDSKIISDACTILIQKNLETILQSEEGTNFLLTLPAKQITDICASDKLIFTKPENEAMLVTLFEKYLKHRDEFIKTLLPEEDPSKNEEYLNETEKKARFDIKEKSKVEEQKKKDDDQKAVDAAYAAKTPLDKANADWEKKVTVIHKEVEKRLKL